MLTRNIECTGRNTMLVSVCWQGILNVQVGIQWECQYADKECWMYRHSHCIPTCTFNIPCQHTDTLIVFLPVHSTFLVSILTLSLYSYLYIQHSLSAYRDSHCIPTCRNTMIVWVCLQWMWNVMVAIQRLSPFLVQVFLIRSTSEW
jgi:hypothetical protein